MTRDDLRAEILKAATFHGDDGTSGYLLAGEQVDAIMRAAEQYAESGQDGRRSEDQPLPKPGTGPSMHDLVCEDIRDRWASGMIGRAPVAPAIAAITASLQERKQLGLKRYKSILQANNGRDALRDLREEVEDAVVYCRQVIEERGPHWKHRANFAIMYDSLIATLFRVREASEAMRPSPGRLWNQAGGDPGEYRRLLREHGHVLASGDEGYDPDAPRTLPCGWSPDKAKPGGGR